MERSRTSFTWEESPASTGTESVTELAERVLFSGSLEEKLRLGPSKPELGEAHRPKSLDFSRLAPTRPSELRFAANGAARPSLPGRPGLVDEEKRGVLLHFFANHELLAAELMALALLKFPDAPPAFRRGLAATLREEQIHTRWYVNRMGECGVAFGQYPLSPFFWDAVSPMACPLDYVSRLSLTFEQANLDYSRHYAEILAEAGDATSAAILRRIHDDEISHVGYGLHWFRLWKAGGESDWSALQERLPFPLSPSRAKGNRTVFNAEARRAAGFDEDYIRRLALFERSKGRTPNVFYFNPDSEDRAARWPAPYHPDKERLAIARDLEILVAFLARRDDVVLMRHPASEAHREHLHRRGLALPEIEGLDREGRADAKGLLASRKLNGFRPWAPAPDLPQVFAALGSALPGDPALLAWDEIKRGLFSKAEQARTLSAWMGDSRAATCPESFLAALELYRSEGRDSLVVKRTYATAGSGMSAIDLAPGFSVPARFLGSDAYREGGFVVEPKHVRVFDFSAQYRIEAGRIRLVGFVEQIVTASGGYRGSVSQPKFCKGLRADLARFLMEEVLPLYADDGSLAADLLAWAAARGYEGALGVDAYIHRTRDARLTLRPVCEVNPRHTLGLVAHELRRRVSPGRGIRLEIAKADRLELSLATEVPVLDEAGRLRRGRVLLTETHPESRFAAVLHISESEDP